MESWVYSYLQTIDLYELSSFEYDKSFVQFFEPPNNQKPRKNQNARIIQTEKNKHQKC